MPSWTCERLDDDHGDDEDGDKQPLQHIKEYGRFLSKNGQIMLCGLG